MKVFVTYDSNNLNGQRTVLRVQTLASVHGLEVELPYRTKLPARVAIHPETATRIQRADFVVWMTGSAPDAAVNGELRVAVAANKPILAIYEGPWSQPLVIKDYPNFKGVPVEHAEQAMQTITAFAHQHALGKSKKQKAESADALIALGLVGLGLWALTKLK